MLQQFCIVANVRNEATGIIEWLEYHFDHVGVEHAYLWLDRCEDDTQLLLEDFIKKGKVTTFQHDHSKGWWSQEHPFNAGIRILRGKFKWVAFIDCDEFLKPIGSQTLLEILEEYEEFGGVCINWRTFGSAMAHNTDADHAVLSSYVFRDKDQVNCCVKTILNLERFQGKFHGCPHAPGTLADSPGLVNTDRVPIKSMMCKGVYNKIVLHHYMTKSFQFWLQNKIPKGDLLITKMGANNTHYRSEIWFMSSSPTHGPGGEGYPIFDDSLAKLSKRACAPMKILLTDNHQPTEKCMHTWAEDGFHETALTEVKRPTTISKYYALWCTWMKRECIPHPNIHDPLFDREWYLEKYNDVKLARVDPWFHYCHNGFKENRSKNANDDAVLHPH